MLVHIGQHDIAERVHNAWLTTMEDGVHTYDVYTEGVSKQKVGTKEFAQAVASRVGKEPQTLKVARYKPAPEKKERATGPARTASVAKLEGIDVYVAWPSLVPNDLAAAIKKADGDGLELLMIDNRGVKVWPGGMSETFCTESFRCRFAGKGGVTQQQTLALLGRVLDAGPGDRQDGVAAQLRRTAWLYARTRTIASAMTPLAGIIMGSKSDWETMRHAAETLAQFGVPHETKIVSAHRTPQWMVEYAESARAADCK